MAESCIFCRIAAGDVPAQLVYHDDDVTVFHDANPQAPVHLLVVPNRHITSLAEASADDGDLLGKLLLACAEAARRAGIADSGFRVVTNTGTDAGQAVFHLHLHVLGGRRLSGSLG